MVAQKLMNFDHIDHIIREFKKWQSMSGLLDQIERQQRLLEPTALEIASRVQDVQKLLNSFPVQIASQIKQYKDLVEPTAREITRIANQWGRNLNISMLEFERLAVQQKHLMEPALLTLNSAWSQHQLLAQQVTDQFRMTRDTIRGLGAWAEGLNQQVNATSQAFSQYSALLESSAGPALRFIASEFNRVIVDTENFRVFQKTFASDFIDYLIRIQSVQKTHHDEELLEGLPDLINRSLEQIPRTRIGLEGIIQIFLTIVIFVWSQLSSMQTEERVVLELRSLGDRIALELQNLKNERLLPQRYVVMKPARLRTGPSVDHPILAVLQPNMIIEVCQVDGQWMQVKYFDFVKSEVNQGWIFKRNLKAITD